MYVNHSEIKTTNSFFKIKYLYYRSIQVQSSA